MWRLSCRITSHRIRKTSGHRRPGRSSITPDPTPRRAHVAVIAIVRTSTPAAARPAAAGGGAVNARATSSPIRSTRLTDGAPDIRGQAVGARSRLGRPRGPFDPRAVVLPPVRVVLGFVPVAVSGRRMSYSQRPSSFPSSSSRTSRRLPCRLALASAYLGCWCGHGPDRTSRRCIEVNAGLC